MQRLGRVLHVSPSRSLIVKTENVPRIGETAIDENLKPVGKVFDIFGPESSPYASIKPTIQDPERLVSKTLYVSPHRGERRKYK